MGNNDNRVVTWSALNSFITQNGGSPKKSSGANSLALKYGEFSEYAPMATSTSSGVVVSDYTGIGGGAYADNQLVIEKDVTWFNYTATSILPTSISVTSDGTLTPGQTWQLTATVLPANADNKTVTWSSENTSIATVDQNGLVTAVSDGVVKIYATSNADPNIKGYATITVSTPQQPEEVTLTAADVTVPVGQETSIYWALSDDSIDIQSVVYDIEDTDIAEMNEEEDRENFVKGLSRGTTSCTITVNGEYTTTITITVVGIFDDSDLNGRSFLHDIFGNYAYNITDHANAFVGSNQPNEGTGYVSTTNMSDSDMEWINNGGITTDVDWIPADQIQIERIGNASSPYIVYKVQPYQDAISALVEYGLETQQGSNVHESYGMLLNGASYTNGEVTPDIGDYYRDGTVTITAKDGSSVSFIVKQYGVIDCKATVRNGEWIEFSGNHMSSLSKPYDIFVYAPQGCTLTKHDTYSWYKIEGFPWSSGIDPYFIVFYGSYNGVTQFPDVLVTTGTGEMSIPEDFEWIGVIKGGNVV